MKTRLIFISLVVTALWLADCTTASKPSAPETNPVDTKALDRAKQIEGVKASIAGKENMPATEVFENISRLKTVNAGRLLEVMEVWGKVLGVRCDFCHVPNEWASEAIPQKATTRQMFDLTNKINADLNKIDLDGISCYTCHRGDTHPVTRVR